MDDFYLTKNRTVLASAKLEKNKYLALVSRNSNHKIRLDMLEKPNDTEWLIKKEYKVKNSISIVNYVAKGDETKIYKIKVNISPPVEFYFESQNDKDLIMNSLMMLKTNEAYDIQISIIEEFLEDDILELLTKIQDFEIIVSKNRINLDECSNLPHFFESQITELSKESVRDIFASQKRIESLTEKISISIDELNSLENKYNEYFGYLDNIRDLINNIESRSTEETSKLGNIKKLQECLEKIITQTDVDLSEFDKYLELNLTEQTDLEKFNNIFDELKKIDFGDNEILSNISFVGNYTKTKADKTAKIVFKVSETIQKIMRQFFPDNNSFNSLNSLTYSQMNNTLSMFKITILNIKSFNPSFKKLISDGYSDLLSRIFLRNINDICSSIDNTYSEEMEIKFCESFYDLIQKSHQIYKNCEKSLHDTFDMTSQEKRKVMLVQIFSQPLSVLVHYFQAIMMAARPLFLLICTLSIVNNEKFDKKFWRSILLPLYTDLVQKSTVKISEFAKEMASPNESEKNKFDRDVLITNISNVIKLFNNTNELFQKLPVEHSSFIDHVVTLIFPAALAHISDSMAGSTDISRYICVAELASDLMTVTQYKFSKKLLPMKNRVDKVFENSINLSIKLAFAIHFEKLQDFFDSIDELIKNNVDMASIQYRSYFKRETALKVLKEFKVKQNRKLINKMIESITKNISADNHSLRKILLSRIKDTVLQNFAKYNSICAKCYSITFVFFPESENDIWNDI